MKIGLMMAPRMLPARPKSPAEFYKDYVGDAVRAERMDFDYVWVGEHHMQECQWTPSSLVVLGMLAGLTTRIRLGTSIICLPFHNPLRVAEDVAVVDALSGGRVELGVGPGSQWEEFHTFGISPKEMFGRSWESIDLIERCFGPEQRFDHNGKYYRFPDVTFTTKPVQKKVPIWWGGFGPKNLQNAAKRGYHLFSPGSPAYDAELRANGHDPAQFRSGFGPLLSLAETREKAFENAAEGVLYMLNFYVMRKTLDGVKPPPEAALTREKLWQANGPTPPTELAPFPFIADTPEAAIPRLKQMIAAMPRKLTHLPVNFRFPGAKNEDVERSMELFNTRVRPYLD